MRVLLIGGPGPQKTVVFLLSHSLQTSVRSCHVKVVVVVADGVRLTKSAAKDEVGLRGELNSDRWKQGTLMQKSVQSPFWPLLVHLQRNSCSHSSSLSFSTQDSGRSVEEPNESREWASTNCRLRHDPHPFCLRICGLLAQLASTEAKPASEPPKCCGWLQHPCFADKHPSALDGSSSLCIRQPRRC